MPTSLLDSLNEQQLEIATAEPCDMFVVAGAGTGKTKVLISRVAYLVSAQECKPWQILAVTFTNKAAEEMRTRLCDALGWDDDDVKSLVVTTFHGLCNKILHRHAIEAGLPSEFSIITTTDQKTLLKRLYTQYGIKSNEGYGDLKDADVDLRTVLNRINNDKQKDIQPTINPQQLKTIRANLTECWQNYDTEDLYQILFACYCQECEVSGVLDFNDLLNRTKKLLVENASIREYYSRRFRYMFIDEFQDTNTIQYQIVMLIKNKYNYLMVVGDDDQGIYAWRGADIANLQRIERDLPHIKKHELTINYRSTQNILTFANAVIAYNNDRIIEKFLTAPDIYEKLAEHDLKLLLSLPKEDGIKAIAFVSEDDSATGAGAGAANAAGAYAAGAAGAEGDGYGGTGSALGGPYDELEVRNIGALDEDEYEYEAAISKMTPSLRKQVLSALIFKHTITSEQAQERLDLAWQLQQEGDVPLVNIVRCSSDASYVKRAIEILEQQGVEYKDIAVLYRNNSLSSPIESMLLNNYIPYQVYGGTKFYERSEIVLVMSYLRLMVNAKDDIAFEMALNQPRRGMGEVYLNKIKAFARSCGLSCYEAISMLIRSGDRAALKDFKKVIPFYELIESLKQKMYTTTLPDLIELVIVKAGLDEYFKDLDTKEHSARFGVSRMDNISQLIINAKALQEKPMSNINELALRIEDAIIGDDGTQLSSYEVFLESIKDDEDDEVVEVDAQTEADAIAAAEMAEAQIDSEPAQPLKAARDAAAPLLAGVELDEDEYESQAAAPTAAAAGASGASGAAGHGQVDAAAAASSKIVLEDGVEITQFDLLLNFISGVALISSVESNEKGQNGDKDDDCIKLMTIHASKGLEFEAVICVGFEEDIIPSRLNDNEGEERRLAYVAVTRAKRHLFVGYCQMRSVYGNRPEITQPSRFIEEAASLLKKKGTRPFSLKKVV